MVSIIVTTWNKTQFMAACGMACITSIRAFTDPKEYELIVIETTDRYPMWDGHGTLGLKDNAIYIQKRMEQDQGNSADMNEGARLAKGEYLCFIENDVILHEGWLPAMQYYLDHDLTDVIIPVQYGTTWENVQKWKSQTHEEGCNPGLEEAGMLMMRKDTFDSVGGWDERMKKLFMWKAFMKRIGSLRIKTTYKTFISHIGGVAYWDLYENYPEEYNKVALEEHI